MATGESGKQSKCHVEPWWKALWGSYLTVLIRRPKLTQYTTCMAVACAGDLLTQLVLEGKSLDLVRLARFAALNFALVGPVVGLWYDLLNAHLARPGLSGALVRMLPDQLLFAPTFSYVVLSCIFSMGAGEFIACSFDVWWSALRMNWLLWPAAQMVNFGVVPPNLQLLFGNVVALLWNMYLSAKTS
eukprot:TRINITY_DN54626_c0_g1_i1.p2 TRINITY_DN54626_c0_g1~~TRINITY_DN54626_c0_g1_i1.p2  ORF type:complete len:187 (+),score=33.37 TRINITY_DN54626_c0_g1_i1:81-641(+)